MYILLFLDFPLFVNILFPIVLNLGQISPFGIIFWSGKLEKNKNYRIENWEN